MGVEVGVGGEDVGEVVDAGSGERGCGFGVGREWGVGRSSWLM